MHKHESVSIQEMRKNISKIFLGVLTKKISIQEALTKFPPDCDDPTIIASWHALCHLEADEDLRRKDSLYKQEQDDFIGFITHTLAQGNELPKNIINSYTPYHPNSLISGSNNIKSIINKLTRFLCI